MTRADIQRQVDEIKWFHAIDLHNGIVTPGPVHGMTHAQLGLAENLRGKSVLDVGAFDGYYSFQAERHGAKRVLATDSYVWDGGWPTGDRGFQLCRKVLRSRVEDKTIAPFDIAPDTVGGRFDVVLFLGVLYHLKHPLLALERLAAVTKGLLVLETHIDCTDIDGPAAAFYPGAELAGDPTNWWGPNPPCVEAMLRTAGFSNVKTQSVWIDKHGTWGRRPGQGRAVFHASI
jgi:tRNA (mo5U34)-methyltransferase